MRSDIDEVATMCGLDCTMNVLLDTHGRIASKIARQLARHIGSRMREMALAVGAHQHL